MKKNLFFTITTLVLTLAFFGCSNSLSEREDTENSTESNVPLKISLLKNNGRYVCALEGGWSLSDIKNWTLTFKNKNTGDVEIGYYDADGYTVTHEKSPTVNVTYDEESCAFSILKIGTGAYLVELEGTPAKEENASTVPYTVYGRVGNLEIRENNQTCKKTVLLELKKKGRGSMHISLTPADTENFKVSADYAEKIVANLRSYSSSYMNITLPLTAVDTIDTTEVNFFVKKTDPTCYEIYVPSLTSGYYSLYFTCKNSEVQTKYYVPTSKQMIEVADGIETTADIPFYCAAEKCYYATNDETYTQKNGLAETSKKEINALLNTICSTLEEYSYVTVYMDGNAPILQTSTIKAVQQKLSSLNYNAQVLINTSKEETESSIIFEATPDTTDDGTTVQEVNTIIQKDVTIKATETDTTVDLTKINNPSSDGTTYTDITITLVDGATLTTESLNMQGSKKLYLSLSTSDGKDNLSAYTDKAMLLVKADSNNNAASCVELKSESYKAYFKTDSETSQTSVYAQLIGNATTTLASIAESASIAATASDGTNYTTAIPYSSSTVTFSLSGVTSEITTYSWLLNGNAVGKDSTMSFIPTESNYVTVNEENTVCLNVLIEDTWYSSEFKFTFISADYSRAVYVATSSGSPTGIYEIEYNNASATKGTSLGSISYYDAYTFDDLQNLWIVQRNATTSETESSSTTYNLHLIKQSKSVSTGSFEKTEEPSNITEYDFSDISLANTSYMDIAYDTKKDMLYVLVTAGTSTDSSTTYTSTVYAFYPSLLNTTTTSDMYYSVEIPTSTYKTALSTVQTTLSSLGVSMDFIFTKLAVYDNTVYMADKSYNVFKLANFTKDTAASITPTWVANLQSSLNIKNPTSTDDSGNVTTTNTDATDALTLTDIQIGDGLGGDTSNLYVLIRQYTSDCVQYSADKTYYSRGALCKIDSSNKVSTYGFSATTTTDTKNTSKTIVFYTPGKSPTNIEFYGPLYFAALTPKKLVIADDGFYYTNEGENGTITNKDGFLLFDIEATTNQLTRASAEISIGIPNVTSYAKEGFD